MYRHASNIEFARRAMTGMANMMSDGEPSQPVEIQLPGWFWGFSFTLAIVFLPIILYTSYTLHSLFPTLAMIEDPEPPAYEPLATNADGPETPRAETDAASPTPSVPITSSLRQMHRLVHSIGGVRSNFRGFWCAFFTAVIAAALQGFFESFIPGRFLASVVAPLPAILLTLPLSTAWTHIAMSQPKAVRWYKRLPNVQKTFSALWRPACIVWVAFAVVSGITRGIALLLGLDAPIDAENPASGVHMLWKTAVVLIVALVLNLGLLVPTHVLFTRIQASLLPLEDEPILAFDRSFGGNVEPQIVNGKGYASLADAWKTFSKASWWRLVKLYAKVIAINFLSWVAIGAVFFPVLYVALNKAKRSDGSTPQ